jgi:DNA topoisomerase-1
MPPKYKSYKKPAVVLHEPNTSATWLVIVESPSKCKKIEEYLGSAFCCVATKGHFRTIDGLKAINTKGNFEPTFSILKEKESQVQMLRNVIAKFPPEKVLLASDDDREGEAIAWHICQVFGLPVETTRRIIFREVTQSALLDAVAHPTIINMKLVQAQHSRQVLDIIVGFKISPYLWKYVGHGSSAGRCQTPALRLIYDNEEKRKTDQKENLMHYKTTASFTSKQILFTLDKSWDSAKSVMTFLEATKTHSHVLTVGSPKEVRRAPPKPFHTSRLLQTASNILHISPKETMQHCQELYQNGHITYMRTESSQYAKPFLEKVKEFILADCNGQPEYVGNLHDLENSNSANPHEAIRVTQLNVRRIQSENARMNAVYQLIWRNTIESCMSTAIFQHTEIRISAALDGQFTSTVEVPVFLGWKHLSIDKEKITPEVNSPTGLILWFKSIEQSKKPIHYQWIESVVVVSHKHSYYTEASLIQELEDIGIGRPSTYAMIVETLIERGYVKKTDVAGSAQVCHEFKMYTDHFIEQTQKERIFGNEKNKLVIEPIGLMVVEFLVLYFYTLFSYEYTKNMEKDLDQISNGEKSDWSLICKTCYHEIKELSKPVIALTKQTFALDETHSFAFQKFGPVIRREIGNGEEPEYLSVKKDVQVNLEKLKRGEYTLEDLMEIQEVNLGKHEGEDVVLKMGRYGLFLEYGEKNISLKFIKKKREEIQLEDVLPYMKGEQVDGKNVLRVLNSALSIRKGRFGPYLYYKSVDMDKPQFLNMKKFPGMFSTCEKEELIQWCRDTYRIDI